MIRLLSQEWLMPIGHDFPGFPLGVFPALSGHVKPLAFHFVKPVLSQASSLFPNLRDLISVLHCGTFVISLHIYILLHWWFTSVCYDSLPPQSLWWPVIRVLWSSYLIIDAFLISLHWWTAKISQQWRNNYSTVEYSSTEAGQNL